MFSRRILRRLAPCLIALACALPAGCMLPYVYPRVSYVESLDLVRQTGEIHAFRVDADGWIKDVGAEMQDHRLAPIPLSADGCLPLQTSVNLEFGYFLFGPLTSQVGATHWTQVRLYRRGYQNIEVTPNRKEEHRQWKPATTLAAQEKAVDDLLWPPEDDRIPLAFRRVAVPWKDNPWPGAHIGPGSLSPKHCESLLFAAGEYEQLLLVWGPKADAAAKERLKGKARHLRERAAR